MMLSHRYRHRRHRHVVTVMLPLLLQSISFLLQSMSLLLRLKRELHEKATIANQLKREFRQAWHQ